MRLSMNDALSNSALCIDLENYGYSLFNFCTLYIARSRRIHVHVTFSHGVRGLGSGAWLVVCKHTNCKFSYNLFLWCYIL